MDHVFTGTYSRLFKIMRCLLKKLHIRSVHQRVELDPSAARALESVQYRRHPGVIQPKMIRLPERLTERIAQVLKEKNIHDLDQQVKYLTNYLNSRKRPTENSELRAAAQYYTRQLSSEDYNNLDSDEQKKLEQKVKNKLKKNLYHWRPISYDESMSTVYLASRMAPNYAATYRVLHEIKKRIPDYQPSTILDFGSGLGSSVWATDSLFPDSVKEYYCVDVSQAMNNLSRSLLLKPGSTGDEDDHNLSIPGVYQRFFLPVSPKVNYDVTISNYSLLEIPSHEERMRLIEILWNKTSDFLILIENGSLEGYFMLMEIRNLILSKSQAEGEEVVDPAAVGHVFSPCPHDVICPRLTRQYARPCNFYQSYEPIRVPGATTKVKGTERFSYLVMRKGQRKQGEPSWPRVIEPVLQRSRHVICRLCNQDGNLKEVIITKAKHEKNLYKTAWYTRWGDLLPIKGDLGDPSNRPDGTENTEETEENKTPVEELGC